MDSKNTRIQSQSTRLFNKVFFLVALSIMFTGCEKSGIFLPTEDKLIGRWEYEKVTFHKNFSFRCTDLTADFNDIHLTFYKDHTISKTITSTGQKLTGAWKIDTENHYFGEQQQVSETLNATLIDFTPQKVELLTWEYLSVTKKKITCTENKNGGTYTYKLVKQ